MPVFESVYVWDSRLQALSFQHRLHRQVTSLRVLGEVLFRPELILQSLGKVPHLLSRGCLECDLGGKGLWGGRQITLLKNSSQCCLLQNDLIWYLSTLSRRWFVLFLLYKTNLFLHLLSHLVSAALCFKIPPFFSHSGSLFPAPSIIVEIYGRLPALLLWKTVAS